MEKSSAATTRTGSLLFAGEHNAGFLGEFLARNACEGKPATPGFGFCAVDFGEGFRFYETNCRSGDGVELEREIEMEQGARNVSRKFLDEKSEMK